MLHFSLHPKASYNIYHYYNIIYNHYHFPAGILDIDMKGCCEKSKCKQ